MSVTVVKCSACGKYFDAEKTESCPYCGGQPLRTAPGYNPNQIPVPGTKPKKEKKWPFGRKKEKEQVPPVPFPGNIPPAPPQVGNMPWTNYDSQTVGLPKEISGSQTPLAEPVDSRAFVGGGPIQNSSAVQPEERRPVSVDLQQQVNMVSDSNKTQGYWSMTAATDSITSYGTTQADPVVGWLVCVKGPHLGESFSLHTGRNTMGRDSSNHIALVKDPKVSREKQGALIYEPKKKSFIIQPGESSVLQYVNDENILSPIEIQKHDIIEFGDTKLMFIPLCGESFSWDSYIEGEK